MHLGQSWPLAPVGRKAIKLYYTYMSHGITGWIDSIRIRINSAICCQLTKLLGVAASCHFIENTAELLAILLESIHICIARSPA